MQQPTWFPTREQLYSGQALANNPDPILQICLLQPNPAWIKFHPTVKVKDASGQLVPLQYLPVDKLEYLMTGIFGGFRREVLAVNQMFNSIEVTVRVHYYHWYREQWEWCDGVGAVAVQTDKGASAADLGAIKSSGVQIATPAAAQYAFKDAVEELGPIFGRDLNKYGTYEIEPFKPEYIPASGVPAPVYQPQQPNPGYAQGGYVHQQPSSPVRF